MYLGQAADYMLAWASSLIGAIDAMSSSGMAAMGAPFLAAANLQGSAYTAAKASHSRHIPPIEAVASRACHRRGIVHREEDAAEFRRPRYLFFSSLLFGAFLVGFVVFASLRERDLAPAVMLLLVVEQWVNAAISLKPPVRMSQESLTLTFLQPSIRLRKVIPWARVKIARREGGDRVVLTLVDGKRFKLRLSHVGEAKRMVYLAALQERLGARFVA